MLTDSEIEQVKYNMSLSAQRCDLENSFNDEAITYLRSIDAFSYIIPSEFGGQGKSYRELYRLVTVVAEECLSTAIVLSMHSQQVATILAKEFPDRKDVLIDIATNQYLVASVTTEVEQGGSVLNPIQKMLTDGDKVVIKRNGPIVSYGEYAKYFVTTMASDNSNKAALVLISTDDGDIKFTNNWKPMGMRGTQSVSIDFNITINRRMVLAHPMHYLASRVMIPVGHLGYGMAWYGTSLSAYKKLLSRLRKASATKNKDLKSPLLRSRLANIRMKLKLMYALLNDNLNTLERVVEGKQLEQIQWNTDYSIDSNNIKLACSRYSVSIVEDIVQISGLFDGYLQNSDSRLEQVHRDIRSAPLMFHNDRLLDINGQLVFSENVSSSLNIINLNNGQMI